jgi:prepilin-type N-terminal cleavage/methylation domain-containing protein
VRGVPLRFTGKTGFTLVELLTVIAIIGVLATLLMTALSTAKRKARQAACTSNLHQISLALNMYLDDHERRPTNLSVLVSSKYLPSPGVLRCPEDKIGNWGGLVETTGNGSLPIISLVMEASVPMETSGVIPYSYLHPLPWDNSAWDRLMKADPSAGIAVCQLHGLGKQNPSFPSIRDFEGLILRAQRDGSVVRRQIFWERPQVAAREAAPPSFDASTGGAGVALAPTMANAMVDTAVVAVPSANYPWQLFTDAPIPEN